MALSLQQQAGSSPGAALRLPWAVARPRVRLRWAPEMKLHGLPDCWEEIPEDAATLADLAEHIRRTVVKPLIKSGPKDRLDLSLDGFLLRLESSITVLRDGDLLDVAWGFHASSGQTAAMQKGLKRKGETAITVSAAPASASQPATKRAKKAAVGQQEPAGSNGDVAVAGNGQKRAAKKGNKKAGVAKRKVDDAETGNGGMALADPSSSAKTPKRTGQAGACSSPAVTGVENGNKGQSRSARRKATQRRLRREGILPPKKAKAKASAPAGGDRPLLLKAPPTSRVAGAGQKKLQRASTGPKEGAATTKALPISSRSSSSAEKSASSSSSSSSEEQEDGGGAGKQVKPAASSSEEEDTSSSGTSSSSSEEEQEEETSSSSSSSSSEDGEAASSGGGKDQGNKPPQKERMGQGAAAEGNGGATADSGPTQQSSQGLQLFPWLCAELPQLDGPRVGAIAAYRILELGASFCPEVSDWRAGVVETVQPLVLRPWDMVPLPLVEEEHEDAEGDGSTGESERPVEKHYPAAYDEDGKLHGNQQSFCELRLLGLNSDAALRALQEKRGTKTMPPMPRGAGRSLHEPANAVPAVAESCIAATESVQSQAPQEGSPLQLPIRRPSLSPSISPLGPPGMKMPIQVSQAQTAPRVAATTDQQHPGKHWDNKAAPVTGAWAALAAELEARKAALAASVGSQIASPSCPGPGGTHTPSSAAPVSTPGPVRRGGARQGALGPLLSKLRESDA